jgi:hypothetical protein
LADCTRLITVAARWPSNSLPANNHAFLPMAHGRMRFSMWLLSMLTAASCGKFLSATQRRWL